MVSEILILVLNLSSFTCKFSYLSHTSVLYNIKCTKVKIEGAFKLEGKFRFKVKKWDRRDVKCGPVQFLAWTRGSRQTPHEAGTHVCVCFCVCLLWHKSYREGPWANQRKG